MEWIIFNYKSEGLFLFSREANLRTKISNPDQLANLSSEPSEICIALNISLNIIFLNHEEKGRILLEVGFLRE